MEVIGAVLTFPLQVDSLLGQFVLRDLVCAGLIPTLSQTCLFKVDGLENICADKMQEVDKNTHVWIPQEHWWTRVTAAAQRR